MIIHDAKTDKPKCTKLYVVFRVGEIEKPVIRYDNTVEWVTSKSCYGVDTLLYHVDEDVWNMSSEVRDGDGYDVDYWAELPQMYQLIGGVA